MHDHDDDPRSDGDRSHSAGNGNSPNTGDAPVPRDPEPWPHHGSRPGPKLPLFDVRFDDLTNPRTGARLERLVLETPDWVNVVAVTPERRVVVVRQYRFGTRDVTIEVPGGMVDPGEEHGDAARRELREESGYESERWTYLGSVAPNPAIHDNAIHHWLAEDARATGALEPDEGEDLVVDLLDADEIVAAVHDGRIRHSLVITALARLFDLRPPEGARPFESRR